MKSRKSLSFATAFERMTVKSSKDDDSVSAVGSEIESPFIGTSFSQEIVARQISAIVVVCIIVFNISLRFLFSDCKGMSIDTHFQKNLTECDKYDVEPYRIKIEEIK